MIAKLTGDAMNAIGNFAMLKYIQCKVFFTIDANLAIQLSISFL
jgi:hypothetical protein